MWSRNVKKPNRARYCVGSRPPSQPFARITHTELQKRPWQHVAGQFEGLKVPDGLTLSVQE